jgi:hypothetical protein
LFIIQPLDVKAAQKKAGKKDLTCLYCGKSKEAKVQKAIVDKVAEAFAKQDAEKALSPVDNMPIDLSDVLSNPFDLNNIPDEDIDA